MVIHSYRRVFKVDRRIYSFGDYLIPVPNGIPLRGFLYFVALVIISFVLLNLPLINLVWGELPWPLRFILVPLWISAMAMMFNPDGRRADLFAITWLAWTARRIHRRFTPERLNRLKWDGKFKVSWDESGTELHNAVIKGPAQVKFQVPVEFNDRWFGWAAEASSDGEVREVTVRPDQTLHVRP